MKTYNRIPASVSVPTTKELAIQYFNYSSWKGKCTDKNYIGVDQETFADCLNVYIDEDGVLRSRPSIKVAKDNKIYMSVSKIYTFGPWTVYKRVSTGNTTSLDFVYGSMSWTMTDVPNDCNIVLADEKIFVFGNNFAKYFDLIDTEILDATDLIYSPVTKTVTTSGEHELESPNMWSKTHRERYIWNRQAPIDLNKLIGKTVTVQIDGRDEQVINSFQKYQEYTITKPILQDLGSDTLYHQITGFVNNNPVRSSTGIPMIGVSKYNSIVRAKSTTKTVSNTNYTYYEVEYSVDGIVFTSLGELPWKDDEPYNCYYIPQFSTDGTIVYVYTSVGIYAISVLSDQEGGNYRYLGWTNLCTVFGIVNTGTYTDYSEFGFAHVDNYNTFAVFTGIRGANDVDYNLHMVRDGTLVTKHGFLTTTEESRLYQHYCKLICNNSHTMLCYITTDPAGFEEYLVNVYSGASDAPVSKRIQLYYVPDLSSALDRVAMYKSTGLYSILDTGPTSLAVVGYTTSGLSIETRIDGSVTSPIVAESDSSILAQDTYIYNKHNVSISAHRPIAVANTYIYQMVVTSSSTLGVTKYDIYSSYFSDNILFTETVVDSDSIDYRYDCEAELSNYYISKGKDLYISDNGSYQQNDFEWYFPKKFVKHFDYEITGLHPISTTEVAAFTQESIFYIVPTTITRNELEEKTFTFYKSRIPLGCAKGCDIVTSYDGKYTIFPTKRGLVAMAYQDFVSSSEQALTFLSDNIADEFFDWNRGAVKITMYKYWAVLYRLDTPVAYVLDMRNSSLWTIEYAKVDQVVEIDKALYVIASNKLHYLDTSEVNYRDDTGKINWYFTSQKLHFNAVNYYKQIQNLTLSAVSQLNAIDDSVAFSMGVNSKLDVTNYRKTLSGETDQSIHYTVNLARTYVARLNYLKVNEFQFTIRSYDEQASQLPLMLTNIAIKFKVTGQVR